MRLLNFAPVLLACGTLALVGCSDDPQSVVESGGGGPGNSAGGGGAGPVSGGTGPAPSSAGSISIGGSLFEGNGGGAPMPVLQSDVTVIITADNAYGFGYGTQTDILNYFGGVENVSSGEIFDCPVSVGPETYTVPAADANQGGFLYIVGYADKSTTQGVIAKFFREGAQPVYTGLGPWQACATGQDYDPSSGGPDVATINQYIAQCNANSLDPSMSSVGWVSTTTTANGHLVYGEDNSTPRDRPMPGNEFQPVCDIEASARWMWFDWEAERSADTSAFMWPGGDGNPTKDFVIFRLGAEFVPSGDPK